MRRLITLVSLLGACGTIAAEEILHEIAWSAVQSDSRLRDGQIVPSDEQTPFEQLKIESSVNERKSFVLLVVEDPQVSTATYALVGRVRCEAVTGVGYLEMWSEFANGNRYFSRTLSASGPSRGLQGSCDWREIILPFFITDKALGSPTRIEVNLVLPGTGTVWLGPLRLVQYAPGELPGSPRAWWSASLGGWVGGIGGSLLGCMGGLIGWCAAKGRARGLVMFLTAAIFIIGVASLIGGIAALAAAQPYGVYYPLLLVGVLCTILPAWQIRGIRNRYEQIELRRMSAADA